MPIRSLAKTVFLSTVSTVAALTLILFIFVSEIQKPKNIKEGKAANIPGDCDGDGFVDLFDYGYLSRSFGLTQGQPGFDGRCDFHVDQFNIIDLFDYQILANNFGRTGATSTPLPTLTPQITQTNDPVVMANSDIICTGMGSPSDSSCNHQRVSEILSTNPFDVYLPVGDLCHDPTTSCYSNYYGPSYGRFKSKTHPVPGNHDYLSPSTHGVNYFDYFGTLAGDRTKGYYSFNLGNWHIIALNSQCSEVGNCGVGTSQYNWLENDLRANTKPCTLAYYHIPVFSSGGRANNNGMEFNKLLYSYGGEIVLSGHDHIYERFAPQKPDKTPDNARGLRQFIIGTGGANHTSISSFAPNSEVRNTDTFGVLKLTLHPTGYDWKFIPVSGKTFTDSGTGSCH